MAARPAPEPRALDVAGRVQQGLATYKAHPDWVCAPTGLVTSQIEDDAGLGVWDVTNPALQAYLRGVVDRLVAKYQVKEFKFDFQSWVDCGVHDYLDYEDAFVTMVRAMEQAHPGVTFELDETNDQRAWPFESAALGPSWFDNGHLHGSTQPAKQLHDLWIASPSAADLLDRVRLPRRHPRRDAHRSLPGADGRPEPPHLLDRPGEDPAVAARRAGLVGPLVPREPRGRQRSLLRADVEGPPGRQEPDGARAVERRPRRRVRVLAVLRCARDRAAARRRAVERATG